MRIPKVFPSCGDRFIFIATAHPRRSVFFILLATFLFAFGLPKLVIDSSGSMLIIPGNTERRFYDEARRQFGEDVVLSIVIKADDIFREDVLGAIDRMTSISETLPGVNRVVSLSTETKIRGHGDVLDTDYVIPYEFAEPATLAKAREDTLYQRHFHGEVISPDGKTAAINLFVGDNSSSPRFNEILAASVQKMIEDEADSLGNDVEIYQTGVPNLKVAMRNSVLRDLALLLPLSFALVFVVLFLLYRSISAVIIPALTGFSSVIITLGFMGYCGIPITPLTCIIPLLLVVVGSTEDMHLLSEYGQALAHGEDSQSAIRSMLRHGGLAVLLTSTTTIIGFTTIIWNPIPMLKSFGIAATFGMLVNFFVTVLLVPALLSIIPGSKNLEKWVRKRQRQVGHRFARIAARNLLLTVGASLAIVFVGILGSKNVAIDTDFLGFFRKESQIRQSFTDIGQNLAGAHSFYVIVEATGEGDLMDPSILKKMAAFGDQVGSLTDKVFGYPDLIRTIHQEINGGNPDFYRIPDSRDLIAQYNLLLNQESLDRFVDGRFTTACFLVRTQTSGSKQLRQLLPKIEHLASELHSAGIETRSTGEMVLIAAASDRIATEIVESLLVLSGTVLLVISLLFRSLKAGFLALIPNSLPVLVSFGAMGILGIPLSPTTFPVAIIAFGIAVDDTIHFMVRYRDELQRTNEPSSAVVVSVEKEFLPVFASSSALVLGFLILTTSDFATTAQFGILAAISLTTALLADLFVTPAVFLHAPLIRTQPLRREDRSKIA